MGIFQWLNDQLLKMQWLSDLVGILVRDVFGLDLASRVGGSIHFFIYDVIKIYILLSVLIFSISYVQSFFPPERTKKILGRFDGITANILAALLGTITPFCSCSAVPLFIGFLESGIPLGVTFSFLISSPMVNEVALVMMWGLFGWKIALIYISTGLLVAIIGGIVLGKLKMERYVQDYVRDCNVGPV